MAPDWGHGPNPPVEMFTETEIRDVTRTHYPHAEVEYEENGPEVFCAGCSYLRQESPYGWHREPWDDEHLITKLKETRR